ncbi:LysR family transcriptional regulator [Proteus myxofaciens]|uniref:LysR family transcriptional regulator n=1 Tax=Proteus myxofaciens ATCC 19692 TaxID=1354337 RepID=A0A198GBT5_9GAMM|nr:LysR family transcriptional regulator [Proteus myxofaciens]OAT33706.1 LysR family transcriptional regulator [Proteus myxofaciens ATCC 19692]
MLKIRYLEAFYHVVRLGSVIAAADALFCVPSNITKMIKELESDLSAPLFTREKGRLTVTTFGLHYYDEVCQLLALAGDIEKKYQSNTSYCTLRIGALDIAADYWLPSKIIAFQKAYPNYELKLYRGYSRELENGLLDNRYDIICSDGPLKHPEIESQAGFQSYLQKVGLPTKDSKRDSRINVYSFGNDCLYRTMIEAWIKRQPKGRYHIVDIESYQVIKALVINGFGISFVPQNVITDLQFPENIVGKELIKTETCLAWASFRNETAIEQFITFMKADENRILPATY